MEKLMKNKVGIVTGAASGIGLATALAFAREGALVMVSDVNEAGAMQTAQMIEQAGGTADFCRCDVSVEADMAALVEKTVQRFGRLDFAHNNAGVPAVPDSLVDSSSLDWIKTINTNLTGVYYALKHQISEMLKTGEGAIVITSSATSLSGYKNMSAYSSAKAAVNQLTKCAALEYADKGIRINAVAPGPVNTPLALAFSRDNPEEAKKYTSIIPTGKFSSVDDVSNAVVWLCSDLSVQITGTVLAVDGGISAGNI